MNKTDYSETFSNVLQLGNFIENENFYSELYTLLNKIHLTEKTTYTELQDMFIIFFVKWKKMLLDSSYDVYGPLQTDNIYTLMTLIEYPLLNTYKLKNKTYSDFNIDIDFFTGVFRRNSNIIAEEESDDNIIILEKFEFTKKTNKLKKFILSNNNGIKWEYDKNYKMVYTVFADGEKMKIT